MREAVAPGGHDATATAVALGRLEAEGTGDGGLEADAVALGEAETTGVTTAVGDSVGVGVGALAMSVGADVFPGPERKGKRPATPVTNSRRVRTINAIPTTMTIEKPAPEPARAPERALTAGAAVDAEPSDASKVPRR